MYVCLCIIHKNDERYQLDAMGSPISGTVAEIFLQQLEKTHIKHLIDSKHLIFYARYVDDILIIYDSTFTSPTNIQHYMDTIHGNIKLNPTHETNEKVNFLDLSITRKPISLELRHLPQAHSDRHHHQLSLQSSSRTQARSLWILYK
jgi:hypothetical protein